MRWQDERYVRVYTRDTVDWLALSWDAQSLLMHLLRKVDRAGLLPLGRHGRRAVALVLGQPGLWNDRLAPALLELEQDGCVVVDEVAGTLCVRNFVAAQETPTSDRQRKADQRDRDRAKALSGGSVGAVTAPDDAAPSEAVSVTRCHALSRDVTPNLAEPNRTVPSRAEPGDTRASALPPREEMDGPEAYTPPRSNPSTADAEVLGGGEPLGDDLPSGVDRVFREVRGTGYQLDSADMRASRQLLALAGGSVAEVLRRFRHGLEAQYKQRVDTLAELAQRRKWEANAQPEDRPAKAAAPVGAHVGRGELGGSCAACGMAAQAELRGHALCYPCMGVAQQEVANFSAESVGAWVARRRAA